MHKGASLFFSFIAFVLNPIPVGADQKPVRTNRVETLELTSPQEKDGFQFVIFGDRTGGPVEGIEVLKEAVRGTNLLDPDFVMTVGDLVVAFQAIQRGHGFMQGLLESITDLYENSLFVQNVYDFLSIKPRLVGPSMPKPIPHPLKRGVGFHHVSFHYPGGNQKILDDVSLEIRPGEHIALVGENGAGKTSLVKLLCRLYDPTHGKLTFDGIDLRDFSVEDVRRQVSIMFQDYVQYHLSARENIWLGDTSFPLESERIEAAVKQAGAQGIFKKLSAGYDTILGRRFEGGEELSIGEWQKIALARAFFRDSGILVLDEPTSAMDARAEYELFQRFHSLTKGRTAILISHRLSSVKMVDRIYVLEHGKVVESGTHDELVSWNSRYAALFEMQAEKYR